MKGYYKIIWLSLLIVSSTVSYGGSVESALLKNKYGWQMSVPKCWEIIVIENVKAEENPLVQFSPKNHCVKKFPRKLALAISIPLLNPPTSVEEFVSTRSQLLDKDEMNYLIRDFFLEPKKIKAVVTRREMSPGESTISIEAKTVCNKRNLYFRFSYLLKPEDEKKDLSQLEIDPSVMKVVETFKCTSD